LRFTRSSTRPTVARRARAGAARSRARGAGRRRGLRRAPRARRTLRNEAAGELPPGQHRLDWNAGREVSSGIYVVRVVARSGDLAIATSTKLTLLR